MEKSAHSPFRNRDGLGSLMMLSRVEKSSRRFFGRVDWGFVT